MEFLQRSIPTLPRKGLKDVLSFQMSARNIPLIHSQHVVCELQVGQAWFVLQRLATHTVKGKAIQSLVVSSSTRRAANHLRHGFSKCGMCTSSGMPTTVYWYAALAKIKIQKRINILKSKYNISHTYLPNTQYRWQHYIPHPHCQPVILLSSFLFKQKKYIDGTPKFLYFT